MRRFLRWIPAVAVLARTYGPRGLRLRTIHEVRRALSLFREKPHKGLPEPGRPLDAFRVDAATVAAATDRDRALERAKRVVDGYHQAFRWEWRPLPSTPSAWHRHPITGAGFAAVPWWRISLSAADTGDVKDVWEPARFGWSYDLVRAYLLTGDDAYADTFHHRLEAWAESSPPFTGVHWACGQETAIRAQALLYAEANLADAPSTTPARRRRIATLLAASGERIADAFGYAVSQRNNHAISEAAGLAVLGRRMAGLHPEAGAWRRGGDRWLDRLVREQFASDGWYIQHSFTYLRLALDQCVIAERASRPASILTSAARDRLRAAAALLTAVMEPRTGLAPNHGANDGAFTHPTSLARYRDFRPVLSAVCALFDAPYPSEAALDRETLAWVGAPEPARAELMTDGVHTGLSGWAVARVGATHAFLRAGSYRSRPGHIDPLHLDVRVDGREVVVDPGTYAYNGPGIWRNGLAGPEVHNGPLHLNEAAVRGPRFLWLRWPRGRILHGRREGSGAAIIGETVGGFRRHVRVEPGSVVVEDELLGDPGTVVVRWMLHPEAPRAHVQVEGSRYVSAVEDAVLGWFSPAYGLRVPSGCVETRRALRTGDRIITRIETVPASEAAEAPAGTISGEA